ncbi:MAG: YolD-like family protein [Candidatus Carbobacillus altaicus]|uniref:YolD-like protein n=1 Tax=Candidatus Carbonibacillus altaicus TaxID=2163959 RepID=A0A2R6Y1H3_9BACL|nr:YolD-like family protein [Candidatus Carbobacillus altaicus]PTQ56521.1 MAG: hypothetical protein BSOLF_0156 [Candidatus Carbobacillus altaicus]
MSQGAADRYAKGYTHKAYEGERQTDHKMEHQTDHKEEHQVDLRAGHGAAHQAGFEAEHNAGHETGAVHAISLLGKHVDHGAHTASVWQGSRMMLPEHREALLDWFRSREEMDRPELADDALVELERTLKAALLRKSAVELTWYDGRQRRAIAARGYLLRLDAAHRRLYWQIEGTYTIDRLQIDDLLALTLLDDEADSSSSPLI